VRLKAEASETVKEAVPGRLRGLEMARAARGFKVIINADRWCVTAANEAASLDDPSDPIVLAYGLMQSVYLTVDGTGALSRHWEWSDPTREGPGECQPALPRRRDRRGHRADIAGPRALRRASRSRRVIGPGWPHGRRAYEA
jgi:hypothetical protein